MAEAKAYCQSSTPEITNLKFKAMCGCFDKTQNFYVNANQVKDIIRIVDFADKYELKLVLVGGRDAHMITDVLAEKEIPVILRPVHQLPAKADDAVDLPFATPAIFEEAGIVFALTAPDFSGDVRNLSFHAGTAVANGLDEEAAIQAMTLNPAKILGIDDKVGSLEKGKAATLFVSKGDILEITTHHVQHAFIDGRKIDLNNKQSDLYKKFMRKYDRTPSN